MVDMAGAARYRILGILALSGFVTSFGAHIVATNLPSYAEVVGAGALAIGLLIAVYDFAELFAKPVSGFVADRYGMKRMLLLGLLIFVIGSALFLLIPPKLLLLVRFVQGLGAAALSTISITLVARYFAGERGRAFGIYNAIKGAGYVVAPAAGGFLAARYGFAAIFIASALLGVVALMLSLFLPADRGATGAVDDDDDDMSVKQFVAVFRDRRLLPIYAVIVINMFMVGILFGFLPVYLHGLGYTAKQSGIVLSICTATYLLVQPVAGMLADRWKIRTTVLAGLVLAAGTILIVTFTSGAWLISVVILAGIGVGTVWTNCDALIAALSEPARLGASVGAAQSFKEFGDMVGPLLVGALTQYFGVRTGFVTCGALALLFVIPLLRSSSVAYGETQPSPPR